MLARLNKIAFGQPSPFFAQTRVLYPGIVLAAVIGWLLCFFAIISARRSCSWPC
jgi:hypothetical protein